MNKDLKTIIRKSMQRKHLQLCHYENALYELYDLFDDARIAAGCRTCEHEEQYSKMIFNNRYIACNPSKECGIVVRIADKIKQAAQKEQDCREKYGSKSFKILKDYNPVIISIRDGSETEWANVFNTEEYKALSDEQKISLVALTELDGGLYRIKGIESFFDD